MCASTSDHGSTSFERFEDDASTAVAFAVAEATDRSPTDLPPLSVGIDPDGLDRLFASAGDDCEVTFRYGGFAVTVVGGDPFRIDLSERD